MGKRNAWTNYEPNEDEINYWPDIIYVGIALIAFIASILIGWW